ncbi:glucoamylase [Streptomyces fumigatiscleroticus]|nr:glucoamylase [Streptomyces fumigatiscleroticus]
MTAAEPAREETAATVADDGCPPLGEYAFLSDCRTAALIGPDGAVEWMCAPRFDSPSVFARLLDRRVGGAWELTVDGAAGPSGRCYADDTFVLVSRWTTPSGTAVAHDFLAARPADGDDPRGILPAGALVRLVRCERGRVTVRHRIGARPDYARPDYARRDARWHRDGDALVERDGGMRLTAAVHGDADTDGSPRVAEDGGATAEATLRQGATLAVALARAGEQDGPPAARDAPVLLRRTLDAWRAWCTAGRPYRGYGAERVRRSALVLRALMYNGADGSGGVGGVDGGLVAAPTTSLPEWPGGTRNWDYRHVWHRDAALIVLVLLRLGHRAEAGAYLRALLRHCTASRGLLTPMLAVDGSTGRAERILDHLDGYLGSRPVRHGNDAHQQRQLDVHGQVLDAALVHQQAAGEEGGGLGPGELEALFAVVDTVCHEWQEPDHGIWEIRNRPRHWTSSKLYAWVCLDRGIRLAGLTAEDPPPRYDMWHEVRDRIRESLLSEGYDAVAGVFTQSYGSGNADASLLRLSLLGFLPGDDPRVLATVDRIDAELGENGWLVHRYDPEATDDGIGEPEGGFLLCSFDMVSALVLAGRREEARRRFEALCARAGRFGLFSEEMTADGTLLGNYPQAFTHLALIEAAMNLDAAGNEEELHAWANRSWPAKDPRRRPGRAPGR